MNNNNFNEFINQDYNNFSNWLNTLNPYEFALIGVVAAFVIAPSLNANQQNSIGNFLEEVGQILLVIASQKITVKQANQNNDANSGYYDNYYDVNSDIESLKKEIERLKKEINK